MENSHDKARGESGGGQAELPATLLRRSMFYVPERIAPSAWIEHVPFAFWLVDVLRPRTIVELGAHTGVSFSAMCQSVQSLRLATSCYAVDTWKGDEHCGLYAEDVYRNFAEFHDQHYGAFSRLIRSPFDEALRHFDEGSIDLLHIDGLHTYEAVRHDYESWLPKLSANAVVLFHDTEVRNSTFGVAQFWNEISRDRSHFNFLHGHGLGVVGRGRNYVGALGVVFAANDDDRLANAIRYVFSRLGQSIENLSKRSELERALENAQWAISLRDSDISGLNQALAEREMLLAEREMLLAERGMLLAERDQRIETVNRTLEAREGEAAAQDAQLSELRFALDSRDRELAAATGELGRIYASKAWRLIKPLRAARSAVQRSQLLWPLASKLLGRGSRPLQAASGGNKFASFYPGDVARPAWQTLDLRILIIAETSILQCTKYRVTAKQEMFVRSGVDCTILDWRDTETCRTAMQTHSVVIFYRTPSYQGVLDLMAEARRLKVPSFGEVDDLIFELEGYLSNRNMDTLRPEEKRSLIDGVPIYCKALVSCDEAIASTDGIASAMKQVGARPRYVIENALDRETIMAARDVRRKQRDVRRQENSQPTEERTVTVVYGSGTRTHDGDFLVASAALLRLMELRKTVRLRIIGQLRLPPDFDAFAVRVEHLPQVDFKTYLQLLGECDISIAPLENSVFNDCKSNIKYLESSIVGVPSVCSPRAEFRAAISEGTTGYLAETQDDWLRKLLALVDDPQLRRKIGSAAFKDVLKRYSQRTVSKTQLGPLIDRFKCSPRVKTRVVFANIYYSPRTFGGATIVVEEMAKRLAARGDTEVFIFTSWSYESVPPYSLVRYEVDDASVIAVKLAPQDRKLEIENPKMATVFAEVLKAVKPDLVHLHAMQGLSASLAQACDAANIPYAITLHDAWWLCERQFMIRGDGRYCFQTRIDLKICAACVSHEGFNRYRDQFLRRALRGASALFTPSAYFRSFYVQNGMPESKIFVNKNGVRLPQAGYKKTASNKIRFGYVGGTGGPAKGVDLTKQAFERIQQTNYDLVLVDNTQNLGQVSSSPQGWKIKGRLCVLPAYTQETLDDFFAGIDVLLFPSQCMESFGLTIREALARDVWVIATDSGGTVEEIVEGENGNIIPLGGDAQPLQDAVEALLRDRSKLSNFKNPHKDMIRTYDEQAEELHRFLSGIAAGHRPYDSAELS